MQKFILITFHSTNFAMQAETVLKEKNIPIQIIPTPREITLSCGLSIISDFENYEIVKQLKTEGNINVKALYKMTGQGKNKSIQEI